MTSMTSTHLLPCSAVPWHPLDHQTKWTSYVEMIPCDASSTSCWQNPPACHITDGLLSNYRSIPPDPSVVHQGWSRWVWWHHQAADIEKEEKKKLAMISGCSRYVCMCICTLLNERSKDICYRTNHHRMYTYLGTTSFHRSFMYGTIRQSCPS